MNLAHSSMAVDVSNTFHDLPIHLFFDLLCLFLILDEKTGNTNLYHHGRRRLGSLTTVLRARSSRPQSRIPLLVRSWVSSLLTRCGCAARVHHPVGARRA